MARVGVGRAVSPKRWPSPFKRYDAELGRYGFALSVFRRTNGTVLAAVGERMRVGVEPECAEDGSQFAALWIRAATDEEIAAFVLGISAGVAVNAARPRLAAN